MQKSSVGFWRWYDSQQGRIYTRQPSRHWNQVFSVVREVIRRLCYLAQNEILKMKLLRTVTTAAFLTYLSLAFTVVLGKPVLATGDYVSTSISFEM